jgi:hypothetical protein
VLIGFVVPSWLLAEFAIYRFSSNYGPQFWMLVRNSLMVSALAAGFAVAVGLVLTYGARLTGSATLDRRRASVERGLRRSGHDPGDRHAGSACRPRQCLRRHAMRSAFGISTGLIFTGTIAALVYAYVVRFLAVSYGSLEAGLQRVTPHLDMASRSLGRTAAGHPARGASADAASGGGDSGHPRFRRLDEGACPQRSCCDRSASTRWPRMSTPMPRWPRSSAVRWRADDRRGRAAARGAAGLHLAPADADDGGEWRKGGERLVVEFDI